MAFLTTMDTGYLKPTNEGTQLAAGNRANSGTAITLNNITFNPSSNANLDASPVLSSNDVAEVNVGTIENLNFTIQGRLDMGVSANQALVYPLVRLTQTKGYKLLYYPAVDNSEDKQLVTKLANGHVLTAGEQSAFSIAAAYDHVHVFYGSVTFVHAAGKKNTVIYNLTGIITKSETSTI